MKKISASDLLELSVAERVLLVEDLWDSIAAVPESVPLTDKQRKELDSRLKSYHANPRAGASWDKVKGRLRRKS